MKKLGKDSKGRYQTSMFCFDNDSKNIWYKRPEFMDEIESDDEIKQPDISGLIDDPLKVDELI